MPAGLALPLKTFQVFLPAHTYTDGFGVLKNRLSPIF